MRAAFDAIMRLEMQDVDQPRLDQLRHRQRRGDADQRLVRKTDRAFRDRMDIASEAKAGEVVEQVVAKPSGAFEPVDLRGEKAQRLKIGEGIVQPGCQQKAAPFRQPPHEEFEYGLLVLATVQIGLDHVEFVEIGGERTGERRHMRSTA